MPSSRKTRRTVAEVRFPQEQSWPFLKEKRYMELEPELERYRNDREQEVAMADMLLRCTCCYSDKMLLPRELVYCPSGHKYCKECVYRSAHLVMSLGGAGGEVGCLETGCQKVFGMDELEDILDEKVLSFLKQCRSVADIHASGLENLVSCPYCPYMVVMEDKEDKVVKCLNAEATKTLAEDARSLITAH